MAAPLDSFETRVSGTPRTVHVAVREDVRPQQREALASALAAIPWERLEHAFGRADDVPAQLWSVTVGRGEARRAAWWELWGNVHHQGTVYEATLGAVPFLGAIAAAADHPDRVQAMAFLRQIAVGSGQHAPAVREAVRPVVQALLENAAEEAELVRRALLWLLSAFPSLAGDHPELLRVLPVALRRPWDEVLDRAAGGARDADEEDDDADDREHELLAWALAGWIEPEADGT